MLKSYLTIAWRNLTRNKLASLINITGLSIGLTTAILIFLWINDTLSYDRFHTHYADIYQLMKTQRGVGEVSTGSSVPGQLGPAVRAQMPEVRYAARGAFEDLLLQYEDKYIYQTTFYTDPEFFRFMTFPALQGDPATILLDPGTAAITESAAKRLFGNADPIGKTFVSDNKREYKVAALLRDIPEHSSIRFDIVLPFSVYEKDHSDWMYKWDDNRISTWVELNPNTKLPSLNARMTTLLRKKTDDARLELFAWPLRDVWLRNSFKNGYPNGGRITGLELLASLGFFVVLIACINFMNLATARSQRRSLEVGMRKTLGASRQQLILQFLGESMLLTFFAMLLAIALAKILLPLLNRFMSRHPVSFDLFSGHIWLAFGCIGLFTALVAGSYPAFFLSRFKPVLVLKGLFSHNKGGILFRKSLVTFQFVITIFLIIATIVILKQESYVEARPIGYQPENLIDIPARGDMAGKYNLIRNECMKIPGVTGVSGGSDDLIRFGTGNDGIQWPGKTANQDFFIKVTSVQYDWTKTAGLTMAEGRDFSPAFGADSLGCLINQTAVRKMGLPEPVVGTKLGNNTIIGVVSDFMFNDVFNNPEPMIIYLNTGAVNHIFLRIRNNDQWQQTIAKTGETVKAIIPGAPFEFHFTSEQYQKQFDGIRSTLQTLNWVGSLAILISCMGLFGLSAFLAERRTKEISIRKILGAGAAGIWLNLSKDFLKPVLLGFIIAAPLAGWVMEMMLQHFDYHISLSWWIFALAGMIALLIALATVSFQGIRSALANPANSLRTE
jgi:putative ABC transport system permease protein